MRKALGSEHARFDPEISDGETQPVKVVESSGERNRYEPSFYSGG